MRRLTERGVWTGGGRQGSVSLGSECVELSTNSVFFLIWDGALRPQCVMVVTEGFGIEHILNLARPLQLFGRGKTEDEASWRRAKGASYVSVCEPKLYDPLEQSREQ